MQTTWIVAADSSRARIFEIQGDQDHLREVYDFANPSGRAHNREIESAKHNRFFATPEGTHGEGDTYEPRVDPVEHETELFSKEVSHFLDQACSEHRYDRLCLIAYPKFLGLMRQNLSKETRKLVEDEVPKDISWQDTREIEDYVRNRLH